MGFLKSINKTILGKPLFVNMASLSLLQLANYVIPILIIPFVVRVLGVDFFGKASYAQNIVAYLTIIVNYGFEYSATQDIAIHKNNKQKLCVIFWTVIRFKIKLLLISFLILGVLYFTFSKVHADPKLYFYAALINIGFTLFPTWFFQGIENMAKMSIFNFLIKILGAIFIVVYINSPSDYHLYLLILSIVYIFVGVISFFYVIRFYGLIYPKTNDKNLSFAVLKKGFPIFLNNLFVAIYTTIGMTILGIYLTDVDVGIYSGAHKIITAIIMLTSMPINVALFPVISRNFHKSFRDGWLFFKKCLAIVALVAFCVSLMTFLFAPIITKIFLGEQFEASISLLRWFSILPFLVIVSSLLTVQGLYGLQLQKYAPYIGLCLGIISLMANLVLIPAFGIIGAAVAWGGTQILEILLVSILLMYKKKMNS